MTSITIGAANAFFAADLHLCHHTVARHRGWHDRLGVPDLDGYHEALVKQWNLDVPAGGTVFVLGDVSFAGAGRTLEILNKLNGKLVLVRGNHDKAMNKAVLARFDSVHDLLTVKVQTGKDQIQRIVCCHFPMLAWDMAHYGAWHLHGHSHGKCRYPEPRGKIVDVAIEAQHVFVSSFADIKARMDDLVVAVQDGHKLRLDRLPT